MEKEEKVKKKKPKFPRAYRTTHAKGGRTGDIQRGATAFFMALSSSKRETLCLFKKTVSKESLSLVSARPASERVACLVITSEKRAWGQGWLIRQMLATQPWGHNFGSTSSM